MCRRNATSRAAEQAALGALPVDSIYTPVLKVNYTVENTRVGQITDYDKLTLEVWTDGTISAKEAVSLGRAHHDRASEPVRRRFRRRRWTPRSWWKRTTRARKRLWR